MGDAPDEGPMARVMRRAYGRPDTDPKLVHIRDWHDASDPGQRDHLAQFGAHCLKDTPGAGFAFPVPPHSHKAVTLFDSPGLNDFLGRSLGPAEHVLPRSPVLAGQHKHAARAALPSHAGATQIRDR